MDTTAKLAAVEAKIRRWQTRATRAVNALRKLDAQRRRLQAKPKSVAQTVAGMTAKPGELTPNQKAALAEAIPTNHYDAVEQAAAEMVGADVDTTIPPELKRDANVDALKAERRKREEAERHKMPLTGKAAIDYVKVTPKPKRKGKNVSAHT